MLGKFELSGIAPKPRGVPQIEVSFDLDANSCLTVTAVDKNNSSVTKDIKIDPQKGRLSKDEIENIVKQAEKFKAEDQAARQRVDAKNGLESVIYGARNQFGEKLPEVGKYLDKQVLWLEENQSATTEQYTTKTKEIQECIQKMAAGAKSQNVPEHEKHDMPDVDQID